VISCLLGEPVIRHTHESRRGLQPCRAAWLEGRPHDPPVSTEEIELGAWPELLRSRQGHLVASPLLIPQLDQDIHASPIGNRFTEGEQRTDGGTRPYVI
jgi:hypothetical protein